MIVEPLRPEDRRPAEAFLAERRCEWGSGRTFVARGPGGIAGLARLQDPNPGDGYHREHVRELVACGDEGALGALAAAAVGAAGEATRVEAACADDEAAWIAGLRAAGLAEEARLPEAWRTRSGLRDGLLLGRPGARRGGEPRTAPPPTRGRREVVRTAWADEGTWPALARFVAGLVPGRAYPPGTLLSEAERLETQRTLPRSMPWLLALDAAGEVAGGLVLERPSDPRRAHVRRVHLDVAADARGNGVGARLVREAIASASRHGALRLEADPREGNAGAVGALRAGGFEQAGTQRRAWRLRHAAGAWDEDVVLFSAAVRPQ